MVDDEDIQFQWCIISTDIEDESASQELLYLVAELCLMICGFSNAGAYLECYKELTTIPIKKATGLKRKHTEGEETSDK